MRPDAKQAVQVGVRQGCALHPPNRRQWQQQQQQQQRAYRGMAGWVRLRGPLQVRPCKLGRRIHAAHAPATGPTPPSTVFRDLSEWHGPLLVGVDLGRHGRSTPCVDALRSIVEKFDFDGDPSTHGVDLPEQVQPSSGTCRRRGGVGLRGVRGMDAAAKPPRMGLRRPRNPTPPRPTHRKPRAGCCSCFRGCLGLGRCLCRCRVQPCRPLLR